MLTAETFLIGMIASGTPILYAILGDMIGQKAGIISLSVEGSMLAGACAAFAAAVYTDNVFLIIMASVLAGGVIGLMQAYLVVSRKANMLASGLTLIFFTQGVTGFAGKGLLAKEIHGFSKIAIPILSDIPVIGPAFFEQDILTYLSYILIVVIFLIFSKTRIGFQLRAVGENKNALKAYGINSARVQYLAVCVGGALAGMGGAHLSTAYTMSWVDNISAGRGMVASALVILCSWKVQRSMAAAYLFGGAQALQILLQIFNINIPTYIMLMLPYLIILAALAVVSRSGNKNMPGELVKISEIARNNT